MTPARDFDPAYEGTPPWDIGRPQPEVVAMVEADAFESPVVDVGCGTGENALFLAAHGLEVVGVDASPRAIDKARKKAETRGLDVRFRVADALDLDPADGTFASALDCGLFHVFDGPERARYVDSLLRVLQPEATLHLLCFSDREPDWGGPRRVSRQEIRDAFDEGWDVEAVGAADFVTNLEGGPVKAWRARIRRGMG